MLNVEDDLCLHLVYLVSIILLVIMATFKMGRKSADVVVTVREIKPRKLVPRTGSVVKNDEEKVKCSDSLPSKFAIKWSEHITKKHHFKAFVTQPQQDVRKDRKGITIHKATDRRAEPWQQKIRANIHKLSIRELPPKTATYKEVREWLYLVLAQDRNKKWVNQYPAAVCSTLIKVTFNGEEMRRMTTFESWDICPAQYSTVDDEICRIDRKTRTSVQNALWKAVHDLGRIESKADAKLAKKAAKCCKKEKKALENVRGTSLTQENMLT